MIVGVGMIVLVGMVGLVIDVGMQWGDNRASQNASDASAEAGAIVLMEYMLGARTTMPTSSKRSRTSRPPARSMSSWRSTPIGRACR